MAATPRAPGPQPASSSPLGWGCVKPRRLMPVAFMALLVALALAGCLAPPAPVFSGDCPDALDLPRTLGEVEIRHDDDGTPMVRDATGVWTSLGNLTRIVPTSHDLVELLFLMGHGDRVVAVPNWIDHPAGQPPEGIDGLQRMGRPHNIPAEDVANAEPTLVLDKPHPLQSSALAPPLRGAGIDVVVFDAQEDLHALAKTYAMLGAILEHVDPEAGAKAQSLWDEFHDELTQIHQRVATHRAETGAHCPQAVYMFPANLAAGEGTAAGLILELAGATNLAAQSGLEGYRTLSREALQAGDPQRVIGTTTGGLPSPNSPRWEPTLAGRFGEDAFLAVDPAFTGLTGPRYTEGVRLISEWLHPGAFGLIEPHVTTTTQKNDDSGLTLTLDASGSQAATGDLRYRFLPGTTTEAQDDLAGRFSYTYPAGTDTTAYLLIIDEHRRIHTTTFPIEA